MFARFYHFSLVERVLEEEGKEEEEEVKDDDNEKIEKESEGREEKMTQKKQHHQHHRRRHHQHYNNYVLGPVQLAFSLGEFLALLCRSEECGDHLSQCSSDRV